MVAEKLQLNTKTHLLKGDKWKGFKNFSTYCSDLSFESYINESGYPQYKNPHMKIIEYARNKKTTIEDAAVELRFTLHRRYMVNRTNLCRFTNIQRTHRYV